MPDPLPTCSAGSKCAPFSYESQGFESPDRVDWCTSFPCLTTRLWRDLQPSLHFSVTGPQSVVPGQPLSLSVIVRNQSSSSYTPPRDFYGCLITEIGFPATEGSSKDPCYLSIKITPEYTRATVAPGQSQRYAYRSVLPGGVQPGSYRFCLSNPQVYGVRGETGTPATDPCTMTFGQRNVPLDEEYRVVVRPLGPNY
jgi:hypothetical protein